MRGSSSGLSHWFHKPVFARSNRAPRSMDFTENAQTLINAAKKDLQKAQRMIAKDSQGVAKPWIRLRPYPPPPAEVKPVSAHSDGESTALTRAKELMDAGLSALDKAKYNLSYPAGATVHVGIAQAYFAAAELMLKIEAFKQHYSTLI